MLWKEDKMYLPPFEVTVLGTSSATPAYGRMPSAQVVNFHQRVFLIDCGEGVQLQLRKYHFSIQKIERIFISHLHGDHFFGLFGLLGSMQLLGRKKELYLYAPEPLKDILSQIWAVSDTKLEFELIFNPLAGSSSWCVFEDDQISIHAFPVVHRIQCFGFIFKEKKLPGKIIKEKIKNFRLLPYQYEWLKWGKEVVTESGELLNPKDFVLPGPKPRSYIYCADTLYSPDLSKWFDAPNLIYHEATFHETHADRAAKTFHSTASQAARMAKHCNAKCLLIGHFSARYKDIDILLEEARKIFPDTLAAKEGLTIPVV
ncbi:MAG: ribonuclease Z [Bacteroidia bacterium]|nr:ribonuclease Z [Bacteroidia bacterium]